MIFILYSKIEELKGELEIIFSKVHFDEKGCTDYNNGLEYIRRLKDVLFC